MKFYSPEEDIVVNTLAAIPSCIEKLNFLLNIREENGEFSHWGLERVHGKQRARAAISEAYRSVLREVLIKPVRDLWDEVGLLCADVEGQSRIEYFRRLSEAAYVPQLKLQPDELHLHFTLAALLLAAQDQRANRSA
jgi:hypothetical protein